MCDSAIEYQWLTFIDNVKNDWKVPPTLDIALYLQVKVFRIEITIYLRDIWGLRTRTDI